MWQPREGMAVLDPRQVPVTEEEREILTAGADYASLKDHPGWRRLRTALDEWEQEALHSIEQNLSTDDALVKTLFLRWLERKSLVKALDGILESAIESRRQWLESLGGDQRILEEMEDTVHG